jgi:hypothetical protein
VVLVVVAVFAAAAFAAETSRTEYREAVEPICETNTKANERVLAGVRQEVQQGKLKPAAAKLMRASTALSKTLRELEAVPRPSADEARLDNWFALIKTEAGYFATVAKKLKAGDKTGAQKIVNKLSVTANKANNEVVPFGFHYCRFEQAKFL